MCDADVGLWHCRVDEDIDDFDQAFSDLNEGMTVDKPILNNHQNTQFSDSSNHK